MNEDYQRRILELAHRLQQGVGLHSWRQESVMDAVAGELQRIVQEAAREQLPATVPFLRVLKEDGE